MTNRLLFGDDPEAAWWKLAERNPCDALDNPMASLCLLAQPGRWIALEEFHAQQWVRDGLQWLNPDAVRRMIADNIEDNLGAYEEIFPEDGSVREMMVVQRLFASSKCSPQRVDRVTQRVSQRVIEITREISARRSQPGGFYSGQVYKKLDLAGAIASSANVERGYSLCLMYAASAVAQKTDQNINIAVINQWRRFLRYAKEHKLLTTHDN